jgi:hypothetical protein
MLAKMPQKTAKSPFKNKLTILSLILLMGLGLSAAYFTVPFLQVPIPAPDNLIGNTTNNTISAPLTHTGASAIKIQTPNVNTTPTTNTTSTNVNTQNTTSKQNTNISKRSTTTNSKTLSSSKTTTISKTNMNSKTTPSSTNTKKTTNNIG